MPKLVDVPLFNAKGKTVVLLLCLLEPYFTSGCYIVLDSGFCMLKGIVELKKRGIFVGALIKKNCYLPILFSENAINSHFNNKPVGECDAISLVLDEEKFFIPGMKEPDYIMKIMASGGALISDDKCKNVTMKWTNGDDMAKQVHLQNMQQFDWHLWHCHIVDDHNNSCHSSPALDETWITK